MNLSFQWECQLTLRRQSEWGLLLLYNGRSMNLSFQWECQLTLRRQSEWGLLLLYNGRSMNLSFQWECQLTLRRQSEWEARTCVWAAAFSEPGTIHPSQRLHHTQTNSQSHISLRS